MFGLSSATVICSETTTLEEFSSSVLVQNPQTPKVGLLTRALSALVLMIHVVTSQASAMYLCKRETIPCRICFGLRREHWLIEMNL